MSGSQEADNLRQQLSSAQTIHDNRLHQLELQVATSEEDRPKREELDRTKRANEDAAKTISLLETELRRLRREVEECLVELKDLRSDRDAIQARREDDKTSGDRAKAQAQSHIRVLEERLAEMEHKAATAEQEIAGHVCNSYVTRLLHRHQLLIRPR